MSKFISTVQAPNETVAVKMRESIRIVWGDDYERFAYAAALLRQAYEATPDDHPMQAIILKRLAKIARLERNYDLARKRLYRAYYKAVSTLGIGHAETLRILEKLAKVEEWDTADVKPQANRAKVRRARINRLYATASRQQPPLVAKLIRADRDFVLTMMRDGSAPAGYAERAYRAYGELMSQLPADDSNQERIKAYRAEVRLECDWMYSD